jgi:hypothetical protein
MTRRGFALAVGAWVSLFAAPASADPILKPHKYHGPIPQSAVYVHVGMLGGASNEEMIDFLDERAPQSADDPVEDDFGNGLTLDVGYTHKPHPHFAVRFNASVSLLRSEGSGVFVPQDPSLPDSVLLPVLEYKREFNVDLIVVEASGVYHFSDASVKEFQPYLGAGFSVGFPHEEYTETRVDNDTGAPYTDEVPGIPTEASEWNVSAGVHAVGGIIYYMTNQLGIVGEGRLQLMQGRYEQLEVPNENGDMESVNFVVDYSGFYVSVGVSYGF